MQSVRERVTKNALPPNAGEDVVPQKRQIDVDVERSPDGSRIQSASDLFTLICSGFAL